MKRSNNAVEQSGGKHILLLAAAVSVRNALDSALIGLAALAGAITWALHFAHSIVAGYKKMPSRPIASCLDLRQSAGAKFEPGFQRRPNLRMRQNRPKTNRAGIQFPESFIGTARENGFPVPTRSESDRIQNSANRVVMSFFKFSLLATDMRRCMSHEGVL